MSVMIKRIGADKSRDRVVGILDSIFSQYIWTEDMEAYGREEWWSGYLQQLKEQKLIRDDCDGFSRLVIDLLFFIGGFSLGELAECAVDVDRSDVNIFDHHVGAVFLGNWHYFHCWTPELLTRRQLEAGSYNLTSGACGSPLKIIQHRKCNGGVHDWKPGKVK